MRVVNTTMVCMGDNTPETEIEKALERAALAVESLFIEMQGHAPNQMYEDGYSDAIASAASVVRRLAFPHNPH